jgi:hypothetical protein
MDDGENSEIRECPKCYIIHTFGEEEPTYLCGRADIDNDCRIECGFYEFCQGCYHRFECASQRRERI